MMGPFLQKLVDVAGDALSPAEVMAGDIANSSLTGEAMASLLELLRCRNGFYAFESALHVFPARSHSGEIGLMEWNASELWAREYQGLAADCFFFAQDIFGGQFCLKTDGVYTFDPETGQVTFLAEDLEHWANAILTDYEVLTGYPLAHEWQSVNGRLPAGSRLVPKVPFVLGGEFSVSNLYLLDARESMRMRAGLAIQIRDLPDGSQIQWKIVD